MREKQKKMNKEINLKGKKGITLIALVITIIVLLILAGVTIATLTGDNRLLQKASTAKQENEESKELELIKIAVSAAQVAGNGTITAENLNKELQANFGNEEKVIETPAYWYYKGNRIYKNGEFKVGSILPDEYQQLEYIESTGKQYIDTKLLASNYMDIRVKIEGNYTKTSYQYIFGAGFHYDYKTNCSWILMGCINDSKFGAQNGISGKEKEIAVSNTQKHTFIVDTVSNVGKVDQVSQVLDSSGVKVINYNYVLFAINNHGIVKDNASFKMNYCNISNNNTLIRNYIPCKSITSVTNADGNTVSSDTKGLYDLVEGKFYTNKGGDIDFTPGPEI